MNARNLAMCFAPSLFNACAGWKSKTSAAEGRRSGRTRRRRARVEDGVISEKDMAEQRAAHECLTTMVVNAKDLFTVRFCYFSYRQPALCHKLPWHRLFAHCVWRLLLHHSVTSSLHLLWSSSLVYSIYDTKQPLFCQLPIFLFITTNESN